MTVMVETVVVVIVTERGGPSGAAVIICNIVNTERRHHSLTIFQSVCGALVSGGWSRTHNSVCSEHDGVGGPLE